MLIPAVRLRRVPGPVLADRRGALVLACGLLACAVAADARAQAPALIPDPLSCGRCRIELAEVARLAGDRIPTAPERVVRDARGRYWLAWSNLPAQAFDGRGRFLLELKRGGGPGEFQYPWSVVPVGDSVFIQDRTRGVMVLGPDLQVVRALPPTRIMGGVLAFHWPDSVLIHTRRFDRPDDPSPFHVVSYSGREVRISRSFGAEAAGDAGRSPYAGVQRVIARAKGGFWAARQDSYQLERWTLQGRRELGLERRPAWFPREPARFSLRAPPPPHVRGLVEDGQGLLWVFISVAAPTWREGYPAFAPESGAREVGPEAFSYEKLFRTTVEVIDPAARRVVARRTLEGYVVSPLDGGLAAMYDTTPEGEPFVRIVRLELQGRTAARSAGGGR